MSCSTHSYKFGQQSIRACQETFSVVVYCVHVHVSHYKMAANLDSKNGCPICSENYKEARKLPGCSHVFCENCIFRYLNNLKLEGKLELEFDCPVCRTKSELPDKGDVKIEWIRSLDPCLEVRTKQKLNASEPVTDCCSQCKFLDKPTKAEHYCVNCRESFCGTCCELLHSFKQNNNHVTLEIEDYSKQYHCEAVKLLRTMLTCGHHNDAPIEQWCQDDDALCCIYCVTAKHRLCSSVRNIAELPGGKAVLQTDPLDMLGMCKMITDHLQKVTDLIKTNGNDVKKQTDAVKKRFQDMKQKTIHLLDAMEENINQQCKTVTKKITIKIQDETQEVQNIARKSSLITYLLQHIFDKLSTECRIICTQEITNILFDLERKIVEKGHTRSAEGIVLKTERMFDNLIELGPNETTKLAYVELIKEDVPLPQFKETYSLRLDTITKAGFQTINASNSTYPAFMNMTFLPDDCLILCDTFNGICCLVDDRHELVASHNFNVTTVQRGDNVHTNFIHATPVRSGLIAVSVPQMLKICFITDDIDMKLTCELSCNKTPLAIHGLRNNELAIMWTDPPAFGIMKVEAGSYTESVYFTHDKSGRVLKSSFRMAVDEGRKHVIQPCTIDNAVYCFDFEGNPVFKYIHDELQSPAGVAVDKQGEVYVCERVRSAIHVLSPAGNLLQLFKRECPQNPFGIAFSRRGDRFAVSTLNHFDKVYFFSLEMEGDDTNYDEDGDMDFYDDQSSHADNDDDDDEGNYDNDQDDTGDDCNDVEDGDEC